MDATKLFAKKMSQKTNPYQGGYYSGDVSREDWEKYSIFTINTFAFKVAGFIEEANYDEIRERLEKIDPECKFWQSEYIQSWATPFYRVTIYPHSVDFDTEFNYEIVATCEAIVNELKKSPILNPARVDALKLEWFSQELGYLLRHYDPRDDAILFGRIVMAKSGDTYTMDDLIYDVFPAIIQEYEDELEED